MTCESLVFRFINDFGAIVKGDNLPPAGIPESFKVMLKELQSLSLNVEVLNAEGVAIDMKAEDDDPVSSSNDLGFNIGARPDAAAKADQVVDEPEYSCCVIIEYGPVERAWILSSTRWCSLSMYM